MRTSLFSSLETSLRYSLFMTQEETLYINILTEIFSLQDGIFEQKVLLMRLCNASGHGTLDTSGVKQRK